MEEHITSFYEHDHDQLDQYLRQFQTLKRADFTAARESFRNFRSGLLRHIVWEEEILFPLFEQKTGMVGGGPTAVMREEHLQIKAHLEAIHLKVQDRDPDSDAEEDMLVEILSTHNEKEEGILYPAIDHIVSDEERRAVFEEMKRVPENRPICGCQGLKKGGEGSCV